MGEMRKKVMKEIINEKREHLNKLMLDNILNRKDNKDRVLRASVELDKLIYEYYKLNGEKDIF